MKHFALICVVLFAVTVIVKSEEEFKAEYCKDQQMHGCMLRKCNKDNTQMTAVGCALSQCPGEVIGYTGDASKPYPLCCSHPICKEESGY